MIAGYVAGGFYSYTAGLLISKVKSTVHTNPSRKTELAVNALLTGGIKKHRLSHFRVDRKHFQKRGFPSFRKRSLCPSFTQTEMQNDR